MTWQIAKPFELPQRSRRKGMESRPALPARHSSSDDRSRLRAQGLAYNQLGAVLERLRGVDPGGTHGVTRSSMMRQESATTLGCPRCGAPAAPEAARCAYCKARLATVGCASCFGLLFDGAAYCPHCGAARSRSEEPDADPVRCPACRAAMHWMKVGHTALLECEACDGTWLEAATLEQLCADRERQEAVVHRAVGVAKVAAGTDSVRYRPCPRCKKLMNRLNFGRLSGAIVDVCRGHGTFLDRGELHHIVRFILDGGLARARRVEREQLAEDRRLLRDLERSQVRSTSSASPAWDGRSLGELPAAVISGYKSDNRGR